jgi:hypothetical protein
MDVELEFDGFQWDDGNREKCRRHGVSLAEIESLFGGSPGVYDDPDHSEQERHRADQCRPLHACDLHGPGTARQDLDPPDQRPLHAWQGDTTL